MEERREDYIHDLVTMELQAIVSSSIEDCSISIWVLFKQLDVGQ
jgi:hypothetical protein